MAADGAEAAGLARLGAARAGAADLGGAMSESARAELRDRWLAILDRNGPALWRATAIYESDPSEREDLYQEIGLALWTALPRFRGQCSERTFAFRIAHNRGLTHRWRRAPRGVSIEEAAEIADPRPDPESRADAALRRGRLLGALRRVPLGAREVLGLALEGLTAREIGEVLGITENNAAVRLHRARAALREILSGPGPDAGEES